MVLISRIINNSKLVSNFLLMIHMDTKDLKRNQQLFGGFSVFILVADCVYIQVSGPCPSLCLKNHSNSLSLSLSLSKMELGLSLGDTPRPLTYIDKTQKMVSTDLGFCMGFHGRFISQDSEEEKSGSSDPPVQLDLLPFSPVQRTQPPSQLVRFPWLTQNCNSTTLLKSIESRSFISYFPIFLSWFLLIFLFFE